MYLPGEYAPLYKMCFECHKVWKVDVVYDIKLDPNSDDVILERCSDCWDKIKIT